MPAPLPRVPAGRARRTAGFGFGCATAVMSSAYLAVAGAALGPFLLVPATHDTAKGLITAGARRLAVVERARRSVFFGDRFGTYRTPGGKILRYVAVHSGQGLLSLAVLGLLGFGVVLAVVLLTGILAGSVTWAELAVQVPLGVVLLFLAVQGLIALAALDARAAAECFGQSESELLRARVGELAASRTAVLTAVDIERRRIERDLHDGVQQRLVALSMLLGRARRAGGTTPTAGDLLGQAHSEIQATLAELREVAWRVYPAVLDSAGLEEALRAVAERSGIPARLEYDPGPPGTPPLPHAIRTAAYYVVSEAVTNAGKHSGAAEVTITVRRTAGHLTIGVSDDGTGGAGPAGGAHPAEGTGLAGLRSRVDALDGVLRVDSPPGGGTTVTVEVPCA